MQRILCCLFLIKCQDMSEVLYNIKMLCLLFSNNVKTCLLSIFWSKVKTCVLSFINTLVLSVFDKFQGLCVHCYCNVKTYVSSFLNNVKTVFFVFYNNIKNCVPFFKTMSRPVCYLLYKKGQDLFVCFFLHCQDLCAILHLDLCFICFWWIIRPLYTFLL